MSTHKALTASFICSLIGSAVYVQPVTLVEAGRVLDVRTAAYANRQGILVRNGRIQEIGDFDSVRAHAPKDTVAIDLHNATVLPGLIDCHAHLLIAVERRFLGDALDVAIKQMSASQRALLARVMLGKIWKPASPASAWWATAESMAIPRSGMPSMPAGFPARGFRPLPAS